MSWAEPENGISEMEENPEPEEDSDLPYRQHEDADSEGRRGEEDGPEEDLGVSQEDVRANVCNTASDEGDSGDQTDPDTVNTGVSHAQSVALGVAEPVPHGVEIDLASDAAVNLPQNVGDGGGSVQGSDNAASSVVEGDSFEQDEETAAPECEDEVRHEACSESDRQLFQFQESVPNQNPAASLPNENPHTEQGLSEHPEQEGQELGAVPGLPGGVLSGCQNVQEERSRSTFSGDVEVVSNLEDAPEAEVENINHVAASNSFEEEDNFRLDVGLSDSSNWQDGQFSPSQPAATLQEGNKGEVENLQATSFAQESSEMVAHGNADQDMQAPECDREVLSQDHTSFGDQLGTPQPAQVAQVPCQGQDICDTSSGDSQLPATLNSVSPTPTDISTDSTSAVVPVDAGECHSNPLAASSSHAAPQNELSSIASADHDITPTNFAGDSVNDAHTDTCAQRQSESDRSSGHSFPAQSPVDSPSHQSAQQFPVDHSSVMQSSQTSSDHAHPQTAQLENQQSSTTSSIPTQTNALTTETGLDSESDSGPVKTVNGVGADTKKSSQTNPVHKSQSLGSGSCSQHSSPSTSKHSSPAQTAASLSQAVASESKQFERELALALQSDDEDELLHELDAALLSRSSRSKSSPQRSQRSAPTHTSSDKTHLGPDLNGLQPSFDLRQVQEHNRQLLEQLKIRDTEIARLTRERDSHKEELSKQRSEIDALHKKISTSSSHSSDDLYLPQIKELEKTIAQQQNEMKSLKEKLVSHDSAAKKAVTTLQNELKSRVDQVTKMYEDCLKEKDMMVVRFAESEAKNMEAKRIAERSEAKVKEAMRDKENMLTALKAAKGDKQRAVTNFETKCAEISNLHKELEKLKEAVNSSDYRIKWFQNKLKDELEAHKETKGNLEKTTNRLREAREETEIIRKECQAIVKRYQESEEIKSNSLDKELKLKETELRTQMQERNDTEEIHQMTKRELDSLKAQHKDTIEEAKTYKDKVRCLEEERQQNHQMIENYQEIMQKQKADNADLKAKVTAFATVEEDYKRAQEMIHTLDKDIAELKLSNRELQKDMESCRERESKLLNLQSELSRTNALLRSENTNLSNRASTLTGEVEKLKMEVQELETTVKDLTDKYEEEKAKRKEEIEKMSATLTEKTKECSDFKQKWEDEIDSCKTLKRRHANNVKDLTRQLHQVKRRLETLEGRGDAGSMGSRTNSNGSLNSVENSTGQQAPAVTHQAPAQEFPVITEQVEVDKQVLIERIVRLQKSHARKNEKLEFLGEHIQQLLEEIKKKNRIIQCYALREEAGALSSEDMDANKTLLARKGGIMASVYSVHQQDGNMTLDLSLQINRKLQAVLEDTLLKNITLKENLDTLGEEIARLSQENRRLQLHLQEIEPH